MHNRGLRVHAVMGQHNVRRGAVVVWDQLDGPETFSSIAFRQKCDREFPGPRGGHAVAQDNWKRHVPQVVKTTLPLVGSQV